jgi:AAA domain
MMNIEERPDVRAIPVPSPSPMPNVVASTPSVETPLRQYSLIHSIDELEREAQEQTPLLGQICLKGQATVLYAKPNSGKTLITLKLLLKAIEDSRIEGDSVYYVDADDTSSGVLEKVSILAEKGVHVLAPGFQGFEARQLPKLLEEMIDDGSARGCFVILDTMKKFVSLMDKKQSSGFADIARRFVLKGGTLLGLAHTNKRDGPDGRPIYAGTSDILDDFDCGYMISEVRQSSGSAVRVVQFENLKRRGNVVGTIAYRYNLASDITYRDLLASVSETCPDIVEALQRGAEIEEEQPIIDAIKESIGAGGHGKMEIVGSVSKKFNLPRQAVANVLEKHAGDEADKHLWYFRRGERGLHRYVLHFREEEF